MPVACQSCAPECPQAFGAEGDLPRIIPRGMPGAFLTRPAERFECSGFENLSVICFANATVALRLGHGAGLTAHRAVIQHRAAASLPFRGGKPLRRGRTDSTRKGHAASVTLLRREQLRSASAPTGCGG